jgi:hypothetical protein
MFSFIKKLFVKPLYPQGTFRLEMKEQQEKGKRKNSSFQRKQIFRIGKWKKKILKHIIIEKPILTMK